MKGLADNTASGTQKPKVAIIYSCGVEYSNESENLAHFLCGHLGIAGYSQLYMIGMKPDGSPMDNIYQNKRIRIMTKDSPKPLEVPVSHSSIIRFLSNHL